MTETVGFGTDIRRVGLAEHLDVWTSRMIGEPLTYLTLTARLPEAGTAVVAEVLQELWVSCDVAHEATYRGIKVLTRRQANWLVIEVVGPATDLPSLWDTLLGLRSAKFGGAQVAAAADTVMTRCAAAADSLGVRADLLRWEAVLGAVPEALDIPSPAMVRAVTPAAVDHVVDGLIGSSAKALVLIGDHEVSEVMPQAARFIVDSGYGVLPSNRSRTPAAPWADRGIRLALESDHGGAAIRLAVPVVRELAGLHALFAAALDFGGSHFSTLQRELRDATGLAYTPSTVIEFVNGGPCLCINVDTSAESAPKVLRTCLWLVAEYFGGGGWRHRWRAGVDQLASIYRTAWASPRGRGVFLSANLISGVDIARVPFVAESLASIAEASMEEALAALDVTRIAGAVVGGFSADAMREVLSEDSLDAGSGSREWKH